LFADIRFLREVLELNLREKRGMSVMQTVYEEIPDVSCGNAIRTTNKSCIDGNGEASMKLGWFLQV
jgi:hypothetical protein